MKLGFIQLIMFFQIILLLILLVRILVIMCRQGIWLMGFMFIQVLKRRLLQ